MDANTLEIVKAIQENTQEVCHYLEEIDSSLGAILKKLKDIESNQDDIERKIR